MADESRCRCGHVSSRHFWQGCRDCYEGRGAADVEPTKAGNHQFFEHIPEHELYARAMEERENG
jgi:hypothetical protein